jgi:hypothetical protein
LPLWPVRKQVERKKVKKKIFQKFNYFKSFTKASPSFTKASPSFTKALPSFTKAFEGCGDYK